MKLFVTGALFVVTLSFAKANSPVIARAREVPDISEFRKSGLFWGGMNPSFVIAK